MTPVDILQSKFALIALKRPSSNHHPPVLSWLFRYRRQDLVGDVLAGVIVAIMLVPQSMAYALLAGLPPQVGLYASILPLVLYGLLGSSHALAVGPVAIVSLLVGLAAALMAFVGKTDIDSYKLVFNLASVAWFVSSPFWFVPKIFGDAWEEAGKKAWLRPG